MLNTHLDSTSRGLVRGARCALRLVVALILLTGCENRPLRVIRAEAPDPPEAQIGERLFLETRFAQRFAVEAGDRIDTASVADPVTANLETTSAPRPGPFAGSTINCRNCHLVDDSPDPDGQGTRTYADFARRSPIPDRGDGRTHTPRNSPSLVDSTVPRAVPFVLHFDGEFATTAELIEGTWTGRNFGWLADQHDAALAHLASVVRADDGSGALAAGYAGLPYATLLAGTDPRIPPELVLPEARRLDVSVATDEQVFASAVSLAEAYLDGLRFSRDAHTGDFDGSPFDRFVALNHLPSHPAEGERPIDFARRFREAIAGLEAPVWVHDGADGKFALHEHPFQFGPEELDGLLVFLSEPDAKATTRSRQVPARERGTGNCLACHVPPELSDFALHNAGVSQEGFDAVHGDGAFEALPVPDLAARNADPDRWLPASAAHPLATGPFRAIPSSEDPIASDLGAWNVLGNPAMPEAQGPVEALVRNAAGLPPESGDGATLLPFAVALFKTPVLRDLGQSAPYFHDGSADTLAVAVRHYQRFSDRARAGRVRNAALELQSIQLSDDDVQPLVSFLQSLDEDYD